MYIFTTFLYCKAMMKVLFQICSPITGHKLKLKNFLTQQITFSFLFCYLYSVEYFEIITFLRHIPVYLLCCNATILLTLHTIKSYLSFLVFKIIMIPLFIIFLKCILIYIKSTVNVPQSKLIKLTTRLQVQQVKFTQTFLQSKTS